MGMAFVAFRYPAVAGVIFAIGGLALAGSLPPNWLLIAGCFTLSAVCFLTSYQVHKRKRETTGLR